MYKCTSRSYSSLKDIIDIENDFLNVKELYFISSYLFIGSSYNNTTLSVSCQKW